MPTSIVAELGSFPPGGAAVVFGSSGGVGRALVDELRRSDAFVQVVPFSRNSDPAIDLEDEASLTRAAKHASDVGDIRLAIDATGFLHDTLQQPEKTWRDIEPTKLARSFALNSNGAGVDHETRSSASSTAGESRFRDPFSKSRKHRRQSARRLVRLSRF